MYSLHHIVVGVHQLDIMENFYRHVLDLPLERHWFYADGSKRSTWLLLGHHVLLMLEKTSSDAQKNNASGLQMFALAIPLSSKQALREKLKTHNVSIMHETDYTLYFNDPEGNRIGLSHWPHVG